MSPGSSRILRIRLHIDLEGAAELVELIDVARSDIAGEHVEHIADRDVQRLRLHPVDHHAHLRHAGAERRIEPLQPGLRVAVPHDGLGDGLQLGVIEAAVAQLDLHGEAAGVADALDRRRDQHQRHAVLQLVQRTLKIGVHRTQIGAAARLADAPVLQDHVGNAGIRQRGAVVQHRDAADRDHLIHAGNVRARSSSPGPSPAACGPLRRRREAAPPPARSPGLRSE